MKRTRSILKLAAALVLVGCDKGTENHTRGVSNVCELHHSHMSQTNVPIRNGLIRFSEWGKAFQNASSNGFPHAQEELLAGCIVGPDSPTQAVIYLCKECRQ